MTFLTFGFIETIALDIYPEGDWIRKDKVLPIQSSVMRYIWTWLQMTIGREVTG